MQLSFRIAIFLSLNSLFPGHACIRRRQGNNHRE